MNARFWPRCSAASGLAVLAAVAVLAITLAIPGPVAAQSWGGWKRGAPGGDPDDLEVVFSELSPRPHDTGLVTLMGQNLSEFDLHLRAVLGLPIPAIRSLGPDFGGRNIGFRVVLAPGQP